MWHLHVHSYSCSYWIDVNIRRVWEREGANAWHKSILNAVLPSRCGIPDVLSLGAKTTHNSSSDMSCPSLRGLTKSSSELSLPKSMCSLLSSRICDILNLMHLWSHADIINTYKRIATKLTIDMFFQTLFSQCCLVATPSCLHLLVIACDLGASKCAYSRGDEQNWTFHAWFSRTCSRLAERTQ